MDMNDLGLGINNTNPQMIHPLMEITRQIKNAPDAQQDIYENESEMKIKYFALKVKNAGVFFFYFVEEMQFYKKNLLIFSSCCLSRRYRSSKIACKKKQHSKKGIFLKIAASLEKTDKIFRIYVLKYIQEKKKCQPGQYRKNFIWI